MRAIALAFWLKSQIWRAKVRSFMSNLSSKDIPCYAAKHSKIKGLNANYSPKYYFIHKGAIYLRAGFEEAYKNGFNYKFIDILKE